MSAAPIPQGEVEAALKILREFIAGERNSVGDTWHYSMAEESLDMVLRQQAAALAAAEARCRELEAGIVHRGDDVIMPEHLYLEINASGVHWKARAEAAESRAAALEDAAEDDATELALLRHRIKGAEQSLVEARKDAERLDYIERTFSGMTNRERYLPVQMIWGKGAMGRTLREACDKYMKRDALLPKGEGATS